MGERVEPISKKFKQMFEIDLRVSEAGCTFLVRTDVRILSPVSMDLVKEGFP